LNLADLSSDGVDAVVLDDRLLVASGIADVLVQKLRLIENDLERVVDLVAHRDGDFA
jgi:hypothetical protein